MNPSSEVWFIHLSVITAVQLQQMEWQGASWHHPAQTHTHTHVQHIPLTTHAHSKSHTCICSRANSHALSLTIRFYTRALTASEVSREGEREGGLKVSRKRSPHVFLSSFLIWAFSTCSIQLALSAGIWGPSCKHINVLFCLVALKSQGCHGGRMKRPEKEEQCFRPYKETEMKTNYRRYSLIRSCAAVF